MVLPRHYFWTNSLFPTQCAVPLGSCYWRQSRRPAAAHRRRQRPLSGQAYRRRRPPTRGSNLLLDDDDDNDVCRIIRHINENTPPRSDSLIPAGLLKIVITIFYTLILLLVPSSFQLWFFKHQDWIIRYINENNTPTRYNTDWTVTKYQNRIVGHHA